MGLVLCNSMSIKARETATSEEVLGLIAAPQVLRAPKAVSGHDFLPGSTGSYKMENQLFALDGCSGISAGHEQ